MKQRTVWWGILLAAVFAGVSGGAPLDPEVVPAAEVKIETFVVQNKTSRPLGKDNATLPLGKKGAIQKVVKGPNGDDIVDIAIVVTPVSSSYVAVDLEIQTLARPRFGDRTVVRNAIAVSLSPGAGKFVNVYDHPDLDLTVNAFVSATEAAPEVTLPDVEPKKPEGATLGQPVQFHVTLTRLAEGEAVYSENVTLNTWIGRSATYEMGHDVPKEVILDRDGQGKILYSSESARLTLAPLGFDGADLRVKAEIEGEIYRGSNLVNSYRVDDTASPRVRSGTPFELFAIYGMTGVTSLDPATRAEASGYVFEVIPRY